jgi:hypothetical protein
MKINVKVAIAIGIVVLVVVGLLVSILSRRLIQPGASPSPATGSPSPTGVPTVTPARYSREDLLPNTGPTIYQQTEEYQRIQNEINLTLAPTLEVHKKTGALLDIVPYRGELFTFDYRDRDLTYVVTLDRNRVLEANQEFDAFLRDNGIEDKEWFTRLKIEYR